MHVLLPEKCEPPYASFYLLHGLSDDYTIWLRQTRIEMYARQYPLVVVMPDGYQGFYTRTAQEHDYAKHFGEELVAFIEKTFPVKRRRSARAIGGLSMGGYGALRIGLGHPDTFASVNAHSGAFLHEGSQFFTERRKDMERVFGQRFTGTEHDVLWLARRAQRAGTLPKLRIDCGTEDFLINENRHLHRQLTKFGIPHEYLEFPGAHNWDYWDLHVREALAFHAGNLRIAKLPGW